MNLWTNQTTTKMETKTNKLAEQIRTRHGDDAELRSVEIRQAYENEGGEMIVEGYAAVYNQSTTIRDWMGEYNEVIAPGSFDGANMSDVRLLVNHDDTPFARTTNGTLQLTPDDTGLKVRASIVPTTAGRDLYAMVKRGDLSQMSFAFTTKREEWDETKQQRTILEFDTIYDAAVVTYPAYEGTSIVARSKFANVEPPAEERKAVKNTEEEQREEAPKAAEVREEKNDNSEGRKLAANSKPENMSLRQMQDERAKAFAEFEGLVQRADNEGRALNEAEEQRYDFLRSEVSRLDDKIKRQKDLDAMSARANGWGAEPSRAEAREISKVSDKFSMGRAFERAVAGRPLEGAEAEFQQEARQEAGKYGVSLAGDVSIPEKVLRHAKNFRAGSADNFQAGSGDGSGFVPTNVPGFIEGLYAPSVLEQAGATIIEGATANLKFPRTSVAPVPATGTDTVAVKDEYDGVDEGIAFTTAGMELDELTMAPKQAGFYTDHTKLLLLQGGDGVANFITQELYRGMMNRMDEAALATFAAASINEVSSGDTALQATLVNSMISRVMGQKADHENGVFILSPNAWNLAQSETLVSAVSALYDGNSINGRRAIATANLADGFLADGTTVGGQALFGNFQQGTILAYFGGIDIEFDRSTLSTKAMVRVVMHRYYDFAIRQAGAICKANALT